MIMLMNGPLALVLPRRRTLVATLTRQELRLFPPYLVNMLLTLLVLTLSLWCRTLHVLLTIRTLVHLTLPRITPIKRLVLLALTRAMYGLLPIPVVTDRRTGFKAP